MEIISDKVHSKRECPAQLKLDIGPEPEPREIRCFSAIDWKRERVEFFFTEEPTIPLDMIARALVEDVGNSVQSKLKSVGENVTKLFNKVKSPKVDVEDPFSKMIENVIIKCFLIGVFVWLVLAGRIQADMKSYAVLAAVLLGHPGVAAMIGWK